MKIAIIDNLTKDKNKKYLKQILSTAKKLKIDCYVCDTLKNGKKYIYTDPRKIPKDTNFVISLGGDGTILQAARDLRGYDYPIAGINLGTLGYLAETEMNQVENMLKSLKDGDYIYEDRMMISGFRINNNKASKQCISQSLNDVVIKSKDSFKTVAINLYVNDKFITKYNADGLIISTPTGSTAYNLSAGGPIIEPTTKMMIVTPICSFALGLGSIVFGGKDEIKLEMCSGRKNDKIKGEIIFDGVTKFDFNSGDKLLLKQSTYNAKFLKFTKTSFLEILREKMKK